MFANLRANKRLDRFSFRGCVTVETQSKLFCLVHNIEKLAKNGYAAPNGALNGIHASVATL